MQPAADLTRPVERVDCILVAVESPETAAGAIAVGSELARANGAQLVLVSVLSPVEEAGVMGLDARAVEEDRAHAVIEQFAEEARALGVNAHAHTVRGAQPAETISEVARTVGAHLVVVGRRGRSDLARAVLGDTTARVIAAADCPVLVVPRSARMWKNRILLASDGSAASWAGVSIAAVCARAHGLPVTVLSVEVPRHSAERQAEAQQIVDRTVAELHKQGVDAQGRIARGTASEEVIKMASEVNADLVVIGSEGRSGLGRVILGSNSQAILGATQSAVLVTTAPSTADADDASQRPSGSAGAASGETSPITFLVVVDASEEMPRALDFACRRAHVTGGRVALLQVLPASADRTPLAIAAAARLRMAAETVERTLGEPAIIHVRNGVASQQVMELLTSEPAINALVLAASTDPNGPGPLIVDLVTRHAADLTIPVVIVPGRKDAGRA